MYEKQAERNTAILNTAYLPKSSVICFSIYYKMRLWLDNFYNSRYRVCVICAPSNVLPRLCAKKVIRALHLFGALAFVRLIVFRALGILHAPEGYSKSI